MGQTYVWPGDSVQVLLYFKGSSVNGYFYETITIKDTNCLLERKVVLKGFIGNPTIFAQKHMILVRFQLVYQNNLQ